MPSVDQRLSALERALTDLRAQVPSGSGINESLQSAYQSINPSSKVVTTLFGQPAMAFFGGGFGITSWGAGAWNFMPLSTKVYDPSNLITLGTTPRYTCPVTGVYLCSVEAAVSPSSTGAGQQFIAAVWKNRSIGVNVGDGIIGNSPLVSSTSNARSNACGFINANAGDILVPAAFLSGTVNIAINLGSSDSYVNFFHVMQVA